MLRAASSHAQSTFESCSEHLRVMLRAPSSHVQTIVGHCLWRPGPKQCIPYMLLLYAVRGWLILQQRIVHVHCGNVFIHIDVYVRTYI
jgi:hypothetical protein